MKNILRTSIIVFLIFSIGNITSFGHEIIWKYSEANMEKTYSGKWVNTTAGLRFYLPTEGWEEYSPQSELTTETESEVDLVVLGIETEAETTVSTDEGTETEAETEPDVKYYDNFGINEYSLIQPDDSLKMRLYHLGSDRESYPLIDDIFNMFVDSTNKYLVECNGIQAVHFDMGDTENIAFPEIVGDEESGFTGSVAVFSVICDNREERELFADELFSSVKVSSDDTSFYVENGNIRSEKYIYWQVQEAADHYIRMLTHKKFVSNIDEDEPGLAKGFALMDLDHDGLMELLVQYEGKNPSTKATATDYAIYTFLDGEEKLLQTMEGLGQSDILIYFPWMRLLEYDTYSDDEEDEYSYNYDCYQYNGKEVIHLDYDEVDWSQNSDMPVLASEDFLITNTEENQKTISERMHENMEEYIGENLR